MMTDDTFRRSTLLWIIAGLIGAYVATAWIGGGKIVNEVTNVFLFAFASGTMVAYLPDFRRAIVKRDLAIQDVLALGIFSAWGAVTTATIIAFAWRMNGQPDGWTDHPLWSFRVLASIFGATCHMLAPHAINGTVPNEQWVRMGRLTAAAILAAALVVWLT